MRFPTPSPLPANPTHAAIYQNTHYPQIPFASASAPESQASSSHRAGVSCSITFRHQHPGGAAPPSCALMAQRLHRRQSEVQGRKVPEVTVEELADALALLQAEVVILGLGRRQVDELVREEAGEVVLALLQQSIHRGQW